MAYEKPNYTQAPNAFFDSHLPDIKSMAELKVTLIVFRGTYGWHEKEVDLTVVEIMAKGGMARQSALDGIRLALQRGTIRRRKSGRSFSYEANVVSVQNLDRSVNAIGKESRPTSVKNLDRSVDLSIGVLKKGKKALSDLTKPRRTEEVVTLPFQSQEFNDVFTHYAGHRKSLKRPITKDNREYLFDELRTLGERGAIDAMRKAMAKGWIGLSDPRFGSNGNGSTSPRTLSPEEKARKESNLRQRMTGRA